MDFPSNISSQSVGLKGVTPLTELVRGERRPLFREAQQSSIRFWTDRLLPECIRSSPNARTFGSVPPSKEDARCEVCREQTARKLVRSFEDFDPELERLIMPFDVLDQIVAQFAFVSFTQNAKVKFL